MIDTGGNGIMFGGLLPLSGLLFAFLFGGIPFGLLLARVFPGRARASALSWGALEPDEIVLEAGFWPVGLSSILLDAIKGALPVFLMTFSNGWPGFMQPDGLSLGPTRVMIWTCAFAAALGHCYSPWLSFRNGGRGMFVALGAFAVLSPYAALVGVGGYLFTWMNTRVQSLASLVCLGCIAITHLVLNPIGWHLLAGALLIFLVVMRHETHINALLENTEHSL